MQATNFLRLLVAAAVLGLAPAGAAPLIQSIRVTFITGDDNLRGDSGLDFKYWLDDSASAPEVVHLFPYDPAPWGAPNWVRLIDHTVHEEVFGIPAVELDRIRNVGIGHVRDDSDDQWKMAGIVVVGITGAGEEYVLYANLELGFYFQRVNLYTTVDRVTDWKSRPFHYRGLEPAADEFDTLSVYLKTGTDDLRRGSRAYLRIYFRDLRILEVPLINPDMPEEWGNHRGRNLFFALHHRYRFADVHQVRIRLEGEKDGGRGRDEWDVDAAWVDGFLATPPLARVEGMANGDRRPIATRPTFITPTVRYDPGHINFDGEAYLRIDGPLPWVSPVNSVPLAVTVDTGADDLRAGSEFYVQLFRLDGTFYEKKMKGYYGEEEEWPSHTTNTVTLDFPSALARETFNGYRVRFVGSEFSNEVGAQIDEWTFDGIEMDLGIPETLLRRRLVSTRGEDHHFRESNSHWVGDLGSSTDPLTEDEGIVFPEVMWAEIPPIREVRFVPYVNGSFPQPDMSYPEWYDAFLSGRNPFDQENKGSSGQDIKNDDFDPFSRYAFALGNGEKPQVYLSALPRDPKTGQARMAVTYRRMLGATDVNYGLRHCDDLRKWREVVPDAGDVHVLRDYINGVEWCEVIVRGGFAKGASGFFSVVAERN